MKALAELAPDKGFENLAERAKFRRAMFHVLGRIASPSGTLQGT
jgi:hypothetical protein